jgi:hypothetical protein
MCNCLKCNEGEEEEEEEEKEEERGVVGHHIYYKEGARTFTVLKVATKVSFFLLIKIGHVRYSSGQ